MSVAISIIQRRRATCTGRNAIMRGEQCRPRSMLVASGGVRREVGMRNMLLASGLSILCGVGGMRRFGGWRSRWCYGVRGLGEGFRMVDARAERYRWLEEYLGLSEVTRTRFLSSLLQKAHASSASLISLQWRYRAPTLLSSEYQDFCFLQTLHNTC